ncbi:MAG: hypothetical protein AAFN30_00695 [Actinomycetota bacterium]
MVAAVLAAACTPTREVSSSSPTSGGIRSASRSEATGRLTTSTIVGMTARAGAADGTTTAVGPLGLPPAPPGTSAPVAGLPPCRDGALTVGAAAMEPLVRRWAEVFVQACPDVRFTVDELWPGAELGTLCGGLADAVLVVGTVTEADRQRCAEAGVTVEAVPLAAGIGTAADAGAGEAGRLALMIDRAILGPGESGPAFLAFALGAGYPLVGAVDTGTSLPPGNRRLSDAERRRLLAALTED